MNYDRLQRDPFAQQRFLAYFVLANVAFYILASAFIGFNTVSVLLQAMLAGVAFLGAKVTEDQRELGNCMVATAVALTPGVLVYKLSGTEWQVDGHMYFFAALAMVVGLKSYAAIIAATVAIALHHMSLNFLLPYAVFPEGGNFFRVLFHAVIVLLESAVLLYVVKSLLHSEQKIQEESEASKAALQQAQEAKRDLEQTLKVSAQGRQEARKAVADSFESQVYSVIGDAVNAALHVKEMAQALTKSVNRTAEHSDAVSNTASIASKSVESVSHATAEVTSAIQEIAASVAEATETAKNCANTASLSQDKLKQLQEAMSEIDSVIQAINQVAEQTNLLALNATIEAARAGEAGMGFSVVASEVKSLANETHKMTGEITQKVNGIKSSAADTIQTVSDIIAQIATVDGKTTSIASAVEEQSAATSEIQDHVRHAASGTSQVRETIKGVQAEMTDAAQTTTKVSSATEELASQTGDVKKMVDQFIRKLRENH